VESWKHHFDAVEASRAWTDGQVWKVGPSSTEDKHTQTAKSVYSVFTGEEKGKGFKTKVVTKKAKDEDEYKQKVAVSQPMAYDARLHIYGPFDDVKQTLLTSPDVKRVILRGIKEESIGGAEYHLADVEENSPWKQIVNSHIDFYVHRYNNRYMQMYRNRVVAIRVNNEIALAEGRKNDVRDEWAGFSKDDLDVLRPMDDDFEALRAKALLNKKQQQDKRTARLASGVKAEKKKSPYTPERVLALLDELLEHPELIKTAGGANIKTDSDPNKRKKKQRVAKGLIAYIDEVIAYNNDSAEKDHKSINVSQFKSGTFETRKTPKHGVSSGTNVRSIDTSFDLFITDNLENFEAAVNYLLHERPEFKYKGQRLAAIRDKLFEEIENKLHAIRTHEKKKKTGKSGKNKSGKSGRFADRYPVIKADVAQRENLASARSAQGSRKRVEEYVEEEEEYEEEEQTQTQAASPRGRASRAQPVSRSASRSRSRARGSSQSRADEPEGEQAIESEGEEEDEPVQVTRGASRSRSRSPRGSSQPAPRTSTEGSSRRQSSRQPPVEEEAEAEAVNPTTPPARRGRVGGGRRSNVGRFTEAK
jgi:hypothetical protein